MTILTSARDFVRDINMYMSLLNTLNLSKHCREAIIKSVSEFTRLPEFVYILPSLARIYRSFVGERHDWCLCRFWNFEHRIRRTRLRCGWQFPMSTDSLYFREKSSGNKKAFFCFVSLKSILGVTCFMTKGHQFDMDIISRVLIFIKKSIVTW